jgi:hypothetical protein
VRGNLRQLGLHGAPDEPPQRPALKVPYEPAAPVGSWVIVMATRVPSP